LWSNYFEISYFEIKALLMPRRLAATKHFRLSQRLRQELRAIPAGQQVPTVQELRASHGVSIATVERALRRLEREGLILRPAGRQRFVVAEVHDRALRRIALIRPDYPSSNADAICRAVVEAGRGYDWSFDLSSFRDLGGLDLGRAIGEADAAVFLPSSEAFPGHLLDALRQPRKPLVVLHQHVEIGTASSVSVDDRQVGRLAARHLLALGHRRIAITLDQPHDSTVMERLAGWREAMAEAGQSGLDDLILDCGVESGEDARQVAYRSFLRRLEAPVAFTGLFCISAFGAMGVLRALRERAVAVPDRVSVVAYGDEVGLGAFLNPPLTVVEIDVKAYGRAAAEILDRQLTDPQSPARQVVIAPHLVVHETGERRHEQG